MHEYDTVLKALLQSPQSTVLERITGARIVNARVGLLGVTADPSANRYTGDKKT